MENVTDSWLDYQRGLDYKRKINLLATVDKSERFYSDRQWEGVKSNGLPTPQHNVTARIVDYKVSQVMDNQLKMNFSVDGIDEETEDDSETKLIEVAEILSAYSETTWERVKMDSMNEDGLLDAALSGDMVSFWYWDESINAGDGIMGDINGELIDNVNYFPGNPNSPKVQTQPYIILAFRQMVEDVRKKAKANGVSASDLLLISPDQDTQDQAGDSAKIELDQSNKTIVLLKLWKENGTVWGKEVCKAVTIRKEWDLGTKLYPVALMNWKKRKNSCHGTNEVNGIIPNQKYINKQAALLQLNAMFNAIGKPIYDKTRIAAWSTEIGTAIGVNGEITGAAGFINPGNASPDAYKMLESTITWTKELQGANETALGDNSITKTAAGIISLQKAAAIPLSTIKRRFYQYIEDVGQIWIDFWTSKYTVPRKLTVKENGVTRVKMFDGSQHKDVGFRLKIDIGPSMQWGEITTLQTLDSMFDKQILTSVQYVDRLPSGIIPKQSELLDELQAGDTDKQLLFELMARYVDSLPIDVQEQLKLLPPDVMEQQVKQMMQQGQQPQELPQGMPMQPQGMPQQQMQGGGPPVY